MKKSVQQLLIRSSLIFAITLVLSGCREDPVLWRVESTQQVIAQYVTNSPDHTEFAEILKTTGLYSLLSVRGPFTLFLPSDSVMKVFYAEQGKTSYLDFDVEYLEDLAKNHLITNRVAASDFSLGSVPYLNGLDDYLVTEFEGADIIVNKYALIVNRDIEAANGIIHYVDKVIEPVTKSVYELLSGDPSYSLFSQGLERTGLKDTLNLISFPYGSKLARTRFTILAVADTTFNRYGINTIEELIAHYTDAPDSITYIDNGFYRYMEYHCLGGTYYLNNFETGSQIYPILSHDNNLSVFVQNDYEINRNLTTKEYTGFFIEKSNNPSKNGPVHTVDDLLPVFEPAPAEIVWETTDFFDLQQGDYFGKYYMRWFDGQNTFAQIKWEGDYLLYYFKDHDTGKLLNDDCLSMNGWWWVEVTTPKIMKGRYDVTSNLWSGQIDYAVYIDGVNTALIKETEPAEQTSWGEFDWTETESHTIKVVAKSPGLLFWDTMIFTPIN